MKRNTKILLSAVLALCLISALLTVLMSCSKDKDPLEQNTLQTPSYLDGSTEDNTQDNEENNTDTPTEAPTQSPEEIPEPAPSLEFRSFDNGTCAVIGVGEITDKYIVIPEKSPAGDIVTTIEAGAFYGNKSITVVQIPSTVFTIGELAFSDCDSLVHISVDETNTHFVDVDGVLFDASQTTLMCYPAGKASTSLMLPSSIVKIDSMALYGCDSLKMIKYEGSLEAWEQVMIGEKNYGIYTASLTFSS